MEGVVMYEENVVADSLKVLKPGIKIDIDSDAEGFFVCQRRFNVGGSGHTPGEQFVAPKDAKTVQVYCVVSWKPPSPTTPTCFCVSSSLKVVYGGSGGIYDRIPLSVWGVADLIPITDSTKKTKAEVRAQFQQAKAEAIVETALLIEKIQNRQPWNKR